MQGRVRFFLCSWEGLIFVEAQSRAISKMQVIFLSLIAVNQIHAKDDAWDDASNSLTSQTNYYLIRALSVHYTQFVL